MSSFTFKTTTVEAASALQSHIVGKNVLITGVKPRSLGAEMIRAIAPFAKNIIIASRTQSNVDEVVSAIRKEVPDFTPHFIALDLASVHSIGEASKVINALGLPLHVLVNNAAFTMSDTLSRTKEGFEMQFGVGNLGHFLLTSLLMPSLLLAAAEDPASPARVIQLSSSAQAICNVRFEDPNFQKPGEYNKWMAYGSLKAANVLFAKEFAKRFSTTNVIAFSLDPGSIRETNVGGVATNEELVSWGMLKPDGTPIAPGIFKTLEEGAATQIVAAFDPTLKEHSGAFLNNCVIHNDLLAPWCTSEENATKLWELNEQLLNHTFSS